MATVLLGLTLLALVADVILGWGLRSTYDAVSFAIWIATTTAVGALIVSQLPRHPVGWILLLFGLQGAVTSELFYAWGLRSVEEHWAGAEILLWTGLVSWCPGALMWVLAFLFTPTGRLPGRVWRGVVAAALAGTAAYMIGWTLSPNSIEPITGHTSPYAVDGPFAPALTVIGAVLLSASAVMALASLVIRFRHADGVVRQQLKWVALAGLLLTVTLPLDFALWSVSPAMRVVSPLMLSAMTLALGAAVLQYRLFDVDVIVLRSVAYAGASAVVVGVYTAVSVMLGTVAGRSSAWQVALATLAAAVVFRPVLRAVRAALDRRFDRDGLRARQLVDAFLDGLRSGTDQPDRIEEVLREALGDQQLRVLLYRPGSGTFVDVRGRAAERDPGMAVVQVERSGVPEAIIQHVGTDDPARQMKVSQLADHARLALQMARVGVELNRQLDELDRSRARIAHAADEERQRIQRDLHDGAQQRLVTIGIGMRGVEASLRAGGAGDEAERVDRLVADLAATIEDLRRLTQQLPPPQLEAGIEAAFRELAGRAPLPVLVDADPVRLDRTLERTAYFVGCEGLTNVIKHARASTVTLRARRGHGGLVVTVCDDGIGGARLQDGHGLAGLADRVAAVGGRLQIESGRRGTLLTAELPCE